MWRLNQATAWICIACVICPTLGAQEPGAKESVKRVYRSNKGRDPVAAHRVALALGTGHHVLTRVQSGKTYRGHIERIDSEHLTLQLDRTGQSVAIPYMQIDHLEQNLSALAKVGIVAAIGVGVCFVIWLRIVTDPNY